ncbi:MAG: OstA-like protein, partial [Bacteroidota bacterium]
MRHLNFLPKAWRSLLILVLISGTYGTVYAEKNTRVSISADRLESYEEEGKTCQKLFGNVVFKFEDFTIHAERALYFEENKRIKAVGRIKIVNKDGDTITADQLTYDDSKRLAQLRNQVVFTAE